MKVKKLLALLMCATMVVTTFVACSSETGDTQSEANSETGSEAGSEVESEKGSEKPSVEKKEASIDFEDGNAGFVALFEGKANADASTLEVVDYNGSKALKVTNGSGKVPYVAIDVVSLLGENAANVASVEMLMGLESPVDEFYACSGKFLTWDGGKLTTYTHEWSVYLEKKNPRYCAFKLDTANGESFTTEAGVFIVTLETDNAATAGLGNNNFYIDDIRFLDKDGKLIKADSTVAFAAPDGFKADKDMSNLNYLAAGAVSLDGMSGKTADAWVQDGVEMTADFLAALVPGSIIEIEFSCATGEVWLVFPDAAAGWSRVCQQSATTNNSKNICQITYEQIAAVCGEDTSTWGARLQCEGSDSWTVYSVKVGKNSGLVSTSNKTVWSETTIAEKEWTQAGIDLTADMIAALVPGSIIEIQYSSKAGDMWIVLPDAAKGWTRIEQQTAACNGNICQVTYEQIAAVLGEDTSTWGARLQCESSGAWEVYSISIAKKAVTIAGQTEIPGAACKADAWVQDGPNLTDDLKALLVPGTAIKFDYTCASDAQQAWIVFPDATAGWSRVCQQTANCDGSTCIITYEEIIAVVGEDPAGWGGRLQFEGDGAWEVYAAYIVTIGE